MRTSRGYLRVLEGGAGATGDPSLEIPLDVDTGPFELLCPRDVRLLMVTSRWFVCFTRAPWPLGAPEIDLMWMCAARDIYAPMQGRGQILSRYRIWYPRGDLREREGHSWRSMRRR
jgi:hypothetical protein